MHASVASAAPGPASAPANDETDANRDDEKANPFKEETEPADDVVWNRVVAQYPHTENDEPDEDNPPASADRPGEHEQGRRYQPERNDVGDPVPVVDRPEIAAQQPMLEQPG